jgi:hypothetical protein
MLSPACSCCARPSLPSTRGVLTVMACSFSKLDRKLRVDQQGRRTDGPADHRDARTGRRGRRQAAPDGEEIGQPGGQLRRRRRWPTSRPASAATARAADEALGDVGGQQPDDERRGLKAASARSAGRSCGRSRPACPATIVAAATASTGMAAVGPVAARHADRRELQHQRFIGQVDVTALAAGTTTGSGPAASTTRSAPLNSTSSGSRVHRQTPC